jgi:hypothetical protein
MQRWLTNYMEQRPSWEANSFSASQDIPRILWNPEVHYRIHKSPPPVPILSQLNLSQPFQFIIQYHLTIKRYRGLGYSEIITASLNKRTNVKNYVHFSAFNSTGCALDECIDAVHTWLRSQPKTSLAGGIRRLLNRHTICVWKSGYYVEKWYTLHFSQIVAHWSN